MTSHYRYCHHYCCYTHASNHNARQCVIRPIVEVQREECRKAQLNLLGDTGRALRCSDGGRGGWRVGQEEWVIKNNVNKSTETWLFMAIQGRANIRSGCMWEYLYRMLQRILGAQNRESVMSGPEVTIAASNVRVSRHVEQKYLSSPGEDISL